MERAAVAGASSIVRNVQTRFPDVPGETCAIGGGVALFAGIDSPFSKAMGIGLWERAGRAEAEALTAFYRDRHASSHVCVTPHVDGDFVRALVDLGYVPLSYENALTADLPAVAAQRDGRVGEMRDPHAWSVANRSAFNAGSEDEDADLVALLLCTSPGTTALEIRVDGAIVASACMDVQDEIAGFFAAATTPALRGQGLHSALIGDRIARAVERGARYGRVTTGPGTVSEQNFRRIGFVPLYTRTIWGKPCSDSASAR